MLDNKYSQRGNLAETLNKIKNGSAEKKDWDSLINSEDGQNFLKELFEQDPDNFNTLTSGRISNEIR